MVRCGGKAWYASIASPPAKPASRSGPSPPHYQRIDVAEALALLRELPDRRLVDRLHLSDQPSFLDPWVRRVTGQDGFLLGNATNTGLIVLYLPDRRFGRGCSALR